MFSIETRKSNMSNIVNSVEKYMYDNIYPNNVLNGFFVLIFHWTIVGMSAIHIILGNIDTLFYISVLIWIIIFGLHFYFNGCILTKIERHLWKANDWYGPWMLPFKMLERININLTPTIMNGIFICWGIFLTIFTI